MSIVANPDFSPPQNPKADPWIAIECRLRERWDSLRRRHWDILRAEPHDPPRTVDSEVSITLAKALFSPRHRALLREVLMDLLADDITDIALVVSQERH